MKSTILTRSIVALGAILTSATYAHAGTKYELTITNGSQMPISPAAIYVKNGGEPFAAIGSAPSAGLIQLCQTGNPVTRVQELKANSNVKFVTETNGPILPGETKTVEVDVANPAAQSIHFETMYGKSKDACGVGTVNSHSLVALKQHATSEVLLKDNAVLTGAFTEPTLPAGMTYLEESVCSNAANAIACLRELSNPVAGSAKVRFFSGYLPSLVSALETKFGAADVQTLLFPASGAIQIKLKLVH
jgi:hypothetical protein